MAGPQLTNILMTRQCDELASGYEDARKIRKAEKSAKIKVQEKDKKRANK